VKVHVDLVSARRGFSSRSVWVLALLLVLAGCDSSEGESAAGDLQDVGEGSGDADNPETGDSGRAPEVDRGPDTPPVEDVGSPDGAVVAPPSGPAVAPPNFQFEAATPTSPGEHTFTIYNDCQVGTEGFEVGAITLETSSAEFSIQEISPGLPATVLADACDTSAPSVVTFIVRYGPIDDDDDQNAVLIDITGFDAPLLVALSGEAAFGSWSLTHQYAQELDFSGATSGETRSVMLTSDGPGTLQVKEPTIEHEHETEVFGVVGYLPATDPEDAETLISSWPRGLKPGASIRFDVTYTPPNLASAEPSNGHLMIPLALPGPAVAVLDLYAGGPKGKLVTAPASQSVTVTGAAAEIGEACDDTDPCGEPELCVDGVCAADSGSRHVVLYNEGNGPLTIDSLAVSAAFGSAKLFSLEGAPDTPFDIAANDLLVLDVGWNTAQLFDLDEGEVETLKVHYVEPYTGVVLVHPVGLWLMGRADVGQPEAVITVTEGPHLAGDTLYVHGAASHGGGGAYTLGASSYGWYIVDKPVGSKTRLNADGGVSHSLTPDLPGDYTLELIVMALDGAGGVLVAEPAQTTITVGP